MHLKHDPMKNVVKAMNQGEVAFTYEESSPDWVRQNWKEIFFIGPQIRDLIKDEYFDSSF